MVTLNEIVEMGRGAMYPKVGILGAPQAGPAYWEMPYMRVGNFWN
jgi:hypothetical protein